MGGRAPKGGYVQRFNTIQAPEGYEVGLIDIELVTKENSPSRLNHITTGQHEKAKKDFTKDRSLSYKVTLEQRLLFGSNPERNGGGG